MDINRKLAILADAAKYDASCASSGTDKRDSSKGKGIGSTEGMGICHSYAPDGRCISLLKILLTNHCQYDCLYCVNRASSNVPRARFRVDEVVTLTLDFYRRNYIEGLFLSSGIVKSPDYTMEQVVEVARLLREEHDFRGYIHLKTIPDASEELLKRAGRYADRLSINVELPTEQGLQSLAPEKDGVAIRRSMGRLKLHIDDAKEARKSAAAKPIRMIPGAATRPAKPPRFAPAGQSTQMIVGADGSDDRSILRSSSLLYNSFRMRRVYYSAFSPIPDASRALPLQSPPLVREHRLYQADWLMRFYGFGHEEIVDDGSGLLRLDVDPKLAWALAHPERFPVDLNTAPKELLLRVPGLGVESVGKVLQSRRLRRIRAEDLQQMKVAVRKVLPFVEVDGHRPRREVGEYLLRQWMAPKTPDVGVMGRSTSLGLGALFGADGEVLLLDAPLVGVPGDDGAGSATPSSSATTNESPSGSGAVETLAAVPSSAASAAPARTPTPHTGEAIGLPLTRQRDSVIAPAPASAAIPATPVQLGLFA